MAVIEPLIVQLGPTIAKFILSFWLNNDNLSPNFTADGVSDILSIISSRTSDVIAQRRAVRQFTEIGEKIAESLEPVITTEFKDLNESSKTSVIIALNDVISHSKIDAVLLTKQDWEPTRLFNYLQETSKIYTKSFNQSENLLFARINSEVSQSIVDIASRLPKFSEVTLIEILRRETKIVDIANETLDIVRVIKDASNKLNTEQNRQYFESTYRRQIERKLGKISLIGVDASLQSTKYGLSTAYVTLTAIEDDYNDMEQEYIEYVPLNQILANKKTLFLIGAPGSGKTTFLQWIAVNAVTNSFEGQLASWNNKIPFMIRLREFTKEPLPSPNEFVKHNAPIIAEQSPDGWVQTLLQKGRAIILIDGVDEIPENLRQQTKEWVEDLVNAYPSANFIVTSRPYAVTDGWLNFIDFTIAELQDMDLPTINEFVSRWHIAVRNELTDTNEKNAFEELENALIRTIKLDKSIQSLATNPLLCAVICALHRDNQQSLPNRRTGLYDSACRMLLEERDKRRNIDLGYPILDYDQKKALLQKLAYWMLRNKRPQASKEEAVHQFQKGLKSLQGINGPIDAHKLYELFVRRSGLVQETESNALDFIHRTFLEYLSAVEIIDERDLGVLNDHASDEQWREVIILSAGLADNDGRMNIIKGLVERGDTDFEKGTTFYLLAASCIEAVVMLNPEIKIEVNKRLENLVPPPSANAARALANAGDLAVPFLKWKENYTVDEAINCIRALSEIKTDLSLEMLASYADDQRRKVISQLCKSWRLFDHIIFANTVLSKSNEITFDNETQIEWCILVKHAKTIRILNNEHIYNIKQILNNVNITELEIDSCPNITDISDISKLPLLTSLSLINCTEITDISPLKNLYNLKNLSLMGSENIEDIEVLLHLNNLSTLDIQQCDKADLSILVEMRQLSKLVISSGSIYDNILLLRQLRPDLEIKEH